MHGNENLKDKPEEFWKEHLTEEEYEVLRNKGTEAPFSGAYVDNHEKGMYRCKACGAELFSSDQKFDSGTGWPSFTDFTKAGNVIMQEDTSHGMRRTEILCKNCGGHLGHVFDDGPIDKGGKRYCVNSCSLDFESQHDSTAPLESSLLRSGNSYVRSELASNGVHVNSGSLQFEEGGK